MCGVSPQLDAMRSSCRVQPVDQPAQLEHAEEPEAEANGTKRKARARS
jgi:hypothetical protein